MAVPPKNLRLAKLYDAKNTIFTIQQRNKMGFTNPNQCLNDLFSMEYISKSLGLKCCRDITQIRKATQDYLSGRLHERSYAKLLGHFGKKAGIDLRDLYKENKQEIAQVFSFKTKPQQKISSKDFNNIFSMKAMNEVYKGSINGIGKVAYSNRVRKKQFNDLFSIKKLHQKSSSRVVKPSSKLSMNTIFKKDNSLQKNVQKDFKKIFGGKK